MDAGHEPNLHSEKTFVSFTNRLDTLRNGVEAQTISFIIGLDGWKYAGSRGGCDKTPGYASIPDQI